MMQSVFKALADNSRRELLDALVTKNGQTLSELCKGLEMSRQAVSKHLGILEQAHLVTIHWQGREKLHYLNPIPVQEIYDRYINKFEQHQIEALTTLKHDLEAKESERGVSKPKFVYVSYIATTTKKVWDALINGDFTKQYWYGRRIESTWKVGEKVYFYEGDSDRLTDSGEVLIYDPTNNLAYSFRNEFNPQAKRLGYSRVSFKLEQFADMVKLTLIHDDLPNQETANTYSEGWTSILSSLKTFLETGKALPVLDHLVEHGKVKTYT